MNLKAKGTTLLAGLVLVTVLAGIGLYGDGRENAKGKGNCYCENWKECGFDDPNECCCCDKIGGCKPPKNGPAAKCHR